MNKKTKIITILLLGFLLLPFFSLLAAETDYPELPGATPPTPEEGLPSYVSYIFNLALIIGCFIAVGILIWGGVLYLTSAGNPEQIGSAKKKITSSVVGLIILLCVYLILTTINPELVMLSLPEINPTSGVYLIKDDGEKLYFSDTTSPISLTDIKEIEFISSKDELMGVYLYSKKDFDRGEGGINEEWIETPERTEGQEDGNPVSDVRTSNVESIYFLWKKPGVYLYPETDFEGRPLYVDTSVADLGKIKASGYNGFDNKAQSLKIINNKPIYYGVVLFELPGFISTKNCPRVYAVIKETVEVPDLNKKVENIGVKDYNDPPIGIKELSSLVVFYYDSGNPSQGSIIFYNGIACRGNEKEVIIKEIIENKFDPGFEVRSFRISGSAAVVLKAGEIWEGSSDVRCMYFDRNSKRVEEDGCLSSLNFFTNIYDPNNNLYPHTYIIFPIRD